MISSQRLLIIFFILSLTIGIVSHIYANPNLSSYVYQGTIVFQSTENETTSMESLSTRDSTLYDSLKNPALITQTTIGNPITWGKIIIDVVDKGFNPFSINPNDFDTSIEQVYAYILTLIKSIFIILAIVEIYMLIFNKKNA